MKPIFLALFFITSIKLSLGQTIIHVNENDGHDSSLSGPFKTLGRAQEYISNTSTLNQSIQVRITGNVYVTNRSVDTPLNWTTSPYSITIMSDDPNNRATIKRVNSANSYRSSYLISFVEVSNVYIKDLNFEDAAAGIFFDRSSNCTVDNCHFIIGYFTPSTGPGAIAIGASDIVPENDPTGSSNIIISNNTIEYTDERVYDRCWQGEKNGNSNCFDLYHGIYLGHTNGCIISGNTIKNAPGIGIQIFHGWASYNQINNNNIHICYNHGFVINDTKYGPQRGVDPTRHAILIGVGDSESVSPTTVHNNTIANNIIHSDVEYPRLASVGSYTSILSNPAGTPLNFIVVNSNVYNAHNNNYAGNSYSLDATCAQKLAINHSYDSVFQRRYNGRNTEVIDFNIPGKDEIFVVNKTEGKIWKVHKTRIGDGANMMNGHVIGSQFFGSSISDIEYADGYTLIGFYDGRICKISGTGGGGVDMFGTITPTNYGFSGSLPWFVGSHKFLSGICEISYINGRTLISFLGDDAAGVAKKMLKINGTGSSGANVFAISETATTFSSVSSSYNFYNGYATFWGRVTNVTYNLGELLISFAVKQTGSSNEYGKILKVRWSANDRDGANMFAVTETANGFETVSSNYNFILGSGRFLGYVTKILPGSQSIFCFSDGKVLKVDGNGGTGYNLFAVTETTSGFANMSGFSFYISSTKYPGYPSDGNPPSSNYVTDIISANNSTYVALRNGRIYKILGDETSSTDAFGNNITGTDDFFSTITDVAYINGNIFISLMDGMILKVDETAHTGRMYTFVEFPNDIVPDSYYSPVRLFGRQNIDAIAVGLSEGRIANSNTITSAEVSSSKQFILFPNPTSDQLNIKFFENDEEIKHISIYSAQGQLMMNKVISSSEDVLSLENYTPGIYVVKVNSRQVNSCEKILVK